MQKISEENKIVNIKSKFESLLLDIAIDIESELNKQCKKFGCDDYQADNIQDNTIAVFELNKRKYIDKLINIK